MDSFTHQACKEEFKRLVTHWLLEEQLFQSSPSVFQMNVHENSPSHKSLFNTRMHSDPDLRSSSLKWDTVIISCSLLTQISPFLVCNRIPAASFDVQAPGLMAAAITFHWFVLILFCSSKTGKMNSEHKKHMVCLFTHLSVPFQSIGHKHYNVSPYLISPGAFFPRMPPSVCGKKSIFSHSANTCADFNLGCIWTCVKGCCAV